jgi:hypothetical protein
MEHRGLVGAVRTPIALALLLTIGCAAPSASQNDNSGIYGTVTAGGGAPPGRSAVVRGPCVKVLEAETNREVATGTCDDNGNFRVALSPGRYVVKVAGQKTETTVHRDEWVQRRFFLPLPAAPGRQRAAPSPQ